MEKCKERNGAVGLSGVIKRWDGEMELRGVL